MVHLHLQGQCYIYWPVASAVECRGMPGAVGGSPLQPHDVCSSSSAALLVARQQERAVLDVLPLRHCKPSAFTHASMEAAIGCRTRQGLRLRSVNAVQLEPALEALEAVMENLRRVLDARVYVALGRGLWDCTAREVFDYVEDLREGDQHRVSLAQAFAGAMHWAVVEIS